MQSIHFVKEEKRNREKYYSTEWREERVGIESPSKCRLFLRMTFPMEDVAEAVVQVAPHFLTTKCDRRKCQVSFSSRDWIKATRSATE